MGIDTIKFGNCKLFSTSGAVVFESPEGKKELEGVSMSVSTDRVTLDGPEQKLTFRKDGKAATVVDKLDGNRSYDLDAEGDFRFELGGYQVQASPSAEGTLATPRREVNPLLPLRAVLPQVERVDSPTPRTSLPRQGLSLATSQPWAVGLVTAIGSCFFMEFTPAVMLGATTMMGCHLLHRGLSSSVEKPESYRLPGLGSLREGSLEASVVRDSPPSPGSSHPTRFSLRSAELKMRSGLTLRSDPQLHMSRDQESWDFEGASVVLEDQSVKVKEGSGHLYRVKPDGSLHTEVQGEGEPTDFASVYEVSRSREQTLETELAFEENEVVIDEFRLNYEH